MAIQAAGRVVAVLMLVAGWCGGPALADEGQASAEDRARDIWALLASGQFEQFVATGTEQVQAGLGGGKAQQLWAGLEFQLGGYRDIESAEATNLGVAESRGR